MLTQTKVLEGTVEELSSYEVELLWRFMRHVAELVGDARKFAERQRIGEAWSSDCSYVSTINRCRFSAEANIELGVSADGLHWVARIQVIVTRNGRGAMDRGASAGFLDFLWREIRCERGSRDGYSWMDGKFGLCATLLPRATAQ